MKRHQHRHQHLVRDLAPPAPPCFASRDIWVEFLVSAAAVQVTPGGTEDPLLIHADGRVEFNHRLNFCADCPAVFARQMDRQGRCRPQHLLQVRPASQPTPHHAGIKAPAMP